ncbi:uncharacterized protein [Rutidosis leptorrhynchoides]|uniref:uncharacterized protein n=1 Tax=Rutidosis leptorrhynchoides TaxID=125765 RepID=UPI003A9932D2
MSGEELHSNSGEDKPEITSVTANELPEESIATATDGDNGKTDSSCSTSSSLAKGLSYTISTIIRDFDSQSQQTSKSQDQLSTAIDRLTGELDQLLADAPSPFITQHAAKISGVRKRVSSLNLILKSIQRRVDNIDRLVSAGLPKDEVADTSPEQH